MPGSTTPAGKYGTSAVMEVHDHVLGARQREVLKQLGPPLTEAGFSERRSELFENLSLPRAEHVVVYFHDSACPILAGRGRRARHPRYGKESSGQAPSSAICAVTARRPGVRPASRAGHRPRVAATASTRRPSRRIPESARSPNH